MRRCLVLAAAALPLQAWHPPPPPPGYVGERPFAEGEAERHRTAMGRAWLDNIAPGFGRRSADELLSDSREHEALHVRAEPGRGSPLVAWPPVEKEADSPNFLDGFPVEQEALAVKRTAVVAGPAQAELTDDLLDSGLYQDRKNLDPPERETKAHEGAFIAALITPFGIRPVRTPDEFEILQRTQERAQELEEPAMLIGLPLDFDSASPVRDETWLDDAGIASNGKLALFDLRSISVKPMERLPIA